MPSTSPPPNLRALALTGFLLHAPGQRLLYGTRLSPRAFVLNVSLILATIVAVLFTWRSGAEPLTIAAVWCTGHFTWSALLVLLTLRGEVRAETSEGPRAPL